MNTQIFEAFSLEDAKNGARVCTKTGNDVVFLAHDKPVKKVIARIKGTLYALFFNEDGTAQDGIEAHSLFMKPRPKKIVYVNVYKDEDGKLMNGSLVYESEEEANKAIMPRKFERIGKAIPILVNN